MKHWIYFVLIIATVGIVACNKDSDDSIPVTSSNINLFQAIPGRSFDVYVDTVSIGKGVEYGGSTGYKSFEAKRYVMMITPAGKPDSPYIGGQISLRNGYHYSIFLSENNERLPQVLLVEDNLRTTTAGYGRMRYVNLSDAFINNFTRLTVDIKVHTTLLDGRIDTARYFRRLSYQAATDFADVAAGPHSLFVTYPDSTLALNGTSGYSCNIEDQKHYTIIGYGNAMKPDSFKLTTFVH
ncbi:DUF4397 domain-containing protein [Chitinophaga rhizophila]|uniref:DUF4397 domain-containing protein n=1 Tax=Chitinophaga rhizophila TaxID=2866212 RepID=A0ABS7G963_9BACT|nr:DUF4397 domain-containing protein [Chitinophaga rhizophila]MBW8684206.1 DUF4397 domain-containing protein [Chitinophaga rhizophila]